jgi:urease accessory protein
MKSRPFLTAAALAAMTVPALAHPGHGEAGVLSGFLHPLSGADHILARVAVGLWAAFLGGRAFWLVPGAFVSAMIVGFVFGMNGMVLPAIEPGIAASVVVLGMMIARAARLPLARSMAIVALFGLFHGQAHGAELTGSALLFGLGFTAATVLLHAGGLTVGGVLGQQRLLARALGVLIAGSGLLIFGGMA